MTRSHCMTWGNGMWMQADAFRCKKTVVCRQMPVDNGLEARLIQGISYAASDASR